MERQRKYIVKYLDKEDTYILYYNNKNYVIDDKFDKLKMMLQQVQEMGDGRGTIDQSFQLKSCCQIF